MVFSHIAPTPALRDFVRDYLIAHFRFDREKATVLKPYAPKPEQGITFFVRGRPTSVNPRTGEVQTASRVSIFGQQHQRCDVHLTPEFLMLRVHFEPGALFRLLNVPLYEFGDSYFDAEIVLGGEVRDVNERLSTAGGYADLIAILEDYLVRRVRKATRDVHPADRAASRLTADPLNASLDWLARNACMSPRQFNRKFTERIGVGPKLYSRLVRFHRAYRLKALPGTLLLAVQPAGSLEAFFMQSSKMTKPPTAEEADRQFAAHAMKVVGPPLDVR